ncbi:Uncharacterised protein [[Clostridium] sordellii]|uniref:Uncharacterized protein n=1 Tax=Paraclostridium sordellii TaxID=1505 RepID=A0A0C7R112_PARSO|nr:hypothetical protein [Paeniclostridium sordellii]CEQ02938.1 Uncharacterised protein [[Clostridium] sordellii] [Paeniclostridium sordellii]
MIDNEIEKFKGFIKKYYKYLDSDGGGGSVCSIPRFDLYSRDYLRFAQKSFDQGGDDGLINCVSNLKRAMDCELDTFLFIIDLYNIFKKKNLKVEQKLKFIETLGLFSSKSLERLNTVRNKMEHEYKVPNLIDIEMYFELVEALIRSLQMAGTLLSLNEHQNFIIYDDNSNEIGYLNLEYKREKEYPTIEISWNIHSKKESISVTPKDYNTFAYCLKIHLLLYQKDSIGSLNYIYSEI